MSQTHYCEQVLETFKYLVEGKTTKTPLPADALEQLATGMDQTEGSIRTVKSLEHYSICPCIQNQRSHMQ